MPDSEPKIFKKPLFWIALGGVAGLFTIFQERKREKVAVEQIKAEPFSVEDMKSWNQEARINYIKGFVFFFSFTSRKHC